MSLFDRFRAWVQRFMTGRNGVDQLSYAMVIAALVLTIIGSLFRFFLLTLLADALLIVAFFRIFSKNIYKRAQENRLYLQKTESIRRSVREWVNRIKNGRQYRYFTCPECKTRLRVPRGIGNVTITCKKCGKKFDKKA